jgi:hypothetical protein
MPSVHWGSLIAGAVLGLVVYHLMKSRVGATA